MRVSCLLSLLFLSIAAPALLGQSCTLPADSPILSSSPDDIPPAAGAYIIANDSHYFLGRANHVMAFVQTNPNEQKVWFSLNLGPQYYANCYYNRRYRADTSSPWYWEFSQSPLVLAFPVQPNDLWSSLVIDTVLYSPTPKYGYPGYNYVMFSTYQPHACDGVVAGFAMVSYSMDGVCWTTPQPMRHAGGPSASCAPALGNSLVQIETYDAIDGGDTIYFIGIDGNVPNLLQPANMPTTDAVWGHAPTSAPYVLTLEQFYKVHSVGILTPAAASNYCDPDRFRPYAYFINVAIAWDEVHGDLYVSRAYPWPFDRHWGSNDPCRGGPVTPSADQTQFASLFNVYLNKYQEVQGTPAEPGQFPNRIQIYKMHIGTLTNFGWVTNINNPWVLVADYGNSVGYVYGYTNQPLADPNQINAGRDYDAASFVRDGAGRLQIGDDGAPHVLGSTGSRTSLSVGLCYTTGNERTYFLTFPH
jgi:hypothetical protein